MNPQEHRKRNRIVGTILVLLFIGLFTLSILGFVSGFEATPTVKKIVTYIIATIAGIMGVFLIGAAIFEVVRRIIKKGA